MSATRSSLLSRVQEFDDAESWAEFDRLYRPLLAAYAKGRGLDSEASDDIAQQCMSALTERIRRLCRSGSFRGWLRGMADHKIADYLAARCKHQQADTDLPTQLPCKDLTPDELWQGNWDRTHVDHLLNRLREEFAEHTLRAFELYVLHDQPVDEIGRALGMTANQIYVAKSRVLSRLREPTYANLVEELYEVRP